MVGWLYHCLTPQQHLRSCRGGDHDDDDGWLYHCLTPQQKQLLWSYRGGDHDGDGWLDHCLTPRQQLRSYRGGDHDDSFIV